MTTVIAPWTEPQLDDPAPTGHRRQHSAATPGDTLVVPTGASALLTTLPGQESLFPGDVHFTGDVDEFRSWFSVPGDRFQQGLDPIPPEHLPAGVWTRGHDFAPEDLTTAELEDLRRAANCYLFGYPPLVSAFRDAIEQYYAPFGAAFYQAARIEVEAGATLAVRGYPAVVDLDELVIHQGGKVFVHTPIRLATRALHKVA